MYARTYGAVTALLLATQAGLAPRVEPRLYRGPRVFLKKNEKTKIWQIIPDPVACTKYKALRFEGGLRRPLRSLKKEKYTKLLGKADRGP